MAWYKIVVPMISQRARPSHTSPGTYMQRRMFSQLVKAGINVEITACQIKKVLFIGFTIKSILSFWVTCYAWRGRCLSRSRRKISLTEVNAKYRHLKKSTCKGTLRQVFLLQFIDRRFSCVHSVMFVFSTQLCDLYYPLLPSPLLSVSTLPPSPPLCI